jgi:phosphohistidine phosphatase
MKLYIVRHAIAAPRGTPWVEDDARELTDEGRSKMKRIASGLRALKYRPDLILSSPLPRARQTAEIVLEAFNKGIELKMTPSLAPSGVRRELYREIRQYEKKLEGLMIVGHQPSLGEIAGEIVFGSSDHCLEFKKGGVCAIEWKVVRGAPQGTMISLLTPSIMRKIAV